jgi:hypothetical protein
LWTVWVKATANPEVQEVLERLAEPGATTPTLEPPGPAIGMLAKLLPHPEEWGLAGYQDVTSSSPLLPAPEIKALPAPQKRGRRR